MAIREFEENDLVRFQEMNFALQEFERAYEPECRAHWKDQGEHYAANVVQEHERGNCKIFVVEADDDLVGFVTCRVDRSTNPISGEALERFLYIQDIYLEPDVRRQGIGAALLNTAESYGRSQGVQYVLLGALQKNGAAQGAYRKAGFEEFEVKLKKRIAR